MNRVTTLLFFFLDAKLKLIDFFIHHPLFGPANT